MHVTTCVKMFGLETSLDSQAINVTIYIYSYVIYIYIDTLYIYVCIYTHTYIHQVYKKAFCSNHHLHEER
jgi:hypothetical protein